MSLNLNEEEIFSRLEAFQCDLANQEPIDIVRRHIVFGECVYVVIAIWTVVRPIEETVQLIGLVVSCRS